jgi:hypothetical protein
MVGVATPAPAPAQPDISPVPGSGDKGIQPYGDRLFKYLADAEDLAREIIQGQPYGTFADIRWDSYEEMYRVAGPRNGNDYQNLIADPRFRYTRSVERIFVERTSLPDPVPLPAVRLRGALNENFYLADNIVDATMISQILMRNLPDRNSAYCIIVRDRIVGRYFVDGPFTKRDRAPETAYGQYPIYLEPMYVIGYTGFPNPQYPRGERPM